MDYTLKKLMGGIANGKDVPGDWELISEWVVPGTEEKSIYEKRSFYQGADRFIVWVDVTVSEVAFLTVMQWHREMYRGDLVAAQKDMLRESIAAANNYNNVIMLVGYAALFTIWSQMTGDAVGKFTHATTFWAAIFLSVSVLAFVSWEIFGMIFRGTINVAIAKAVNDPATFEANMMARREKLAAFGRRFMPVWLATVAVAVVSAAVAFVIMLSALLHGAWVSFNG
jgi:hypothetical protein